VGILVKVVVVSFNGFKVVFGNFAASVFLGGLVAKIGFEFAIAKIETVDKETQVRSERKDSFISIFVFVGQFLNNGENILVK
jgi:hypothetical protein